MRDLKRVVGFSLLVLSAALGALPAFAAERGGAQFERSIDALAATSGAEYVAARDALVRELASEGRAELDRRIARASFSRETWKRDVVLESVRAWIAEPELARRAYALEGVRFEKYRAKRRPEPEVGRELRSLDVPAGVLFELAMKTPDVYGGVALEAKERVALEQGVLAALGRTRHPAAPFLLEEVMRDDARSIAVRAVAASALGESGAGEALILAMDDARLPEVVRTSAIAGLGQVRATASVEALVRIARLAPGALRQASIAALGSVASASVLARQRPKDGEAIARRASDALIAMLVASDGAAMETQLVEALAVIADRGSLAALAKAAASRDEAVRARAERARGRVELAIRRRG